MQHYALFLRCQAPLVRGCTNQELVVSRMGCLLRGPPLIGRLEPLLPSSPAADRDTLQPSLRRSAALTDTLGVWLMWVSSSLSGAAAEGGRNDSVVGRRCCAVRLCKCHRRPSGGSRQTCLASRLPDVVRLPVRPRRRTCPSCSGSDEGPTLSLSHGARSEPATERPARHHRFPFRREAPRRKCRCPFPRSLVRRANRPDEDAPLQLVLIRQEPGRRWSGSPALPRLRHRQFSGPRRAPLSRRLLFLCVPRRGMLVPSAPGQRFRRRATTPGRGGPVTFRTLLPLTLVRIKTVSP